MDRSDGLIARARDATGLAEFGDEGFREGLGILLRALDGEARLNETGRFAIDAQIVDLLSQRLRIEHRYARDPAIDERAIVAPLIGLGLPRTGSTALACLLGEDPATRSIRTWESLDPCPPLEDGAVDDRIARAEAAMARRARLFPRMTAMLPSTATSPTECQLLMAYDFRSQLFQAFAHVPSYVEWLNHRADLVPAYAYVKRVLKLLQGDGPPARWRLKNPSHALFVDALDRVFPDARFVMTHRDAAAVVPSVADVYLELRSAYSDAVDRQAIGDLAVEFCVLGMRRMIAFRDAGNEDRFFDVRFGPFMADPIATIADLYAFLGEPLSEDAHRRMEAWRRATPRDAGYVRTPMAEFGVSPERLRERFRFYSERFGVGCAEGGA